MQTEHNKALIYQIFEALNEHDLDSVVTYYSAECRFHGWAPETLDVEGYKENMSALLAAFPDARFPVHDVIADTDHVVVRHSMRGKHQSDFQGIPAGGKDVIVEATAIFRLEDSQVTEIWLNADFLGLLQQLGAVPMPAATVG